MLARRYLVDTNSIRGHWFDEEEPKDATTKFINHIDNTLYYKSQVELSLQMSYSNQALYQNAAATTTHGEATTLLLPAADAGWVLCHRMILGFLKSQCNVNSTKWN